MSPEGLWTLDELVRRAAAALAGPAYPGSPNGRVRDVPDRRTVRWYATIGLVDRPAAMQGRTALYSVRHLRQIVAVKRLQAQGRSLAEVQAELAGATERRCAASLTFPTNGRRRVGATRAGSPEAVLGGPTRCSASRFRCMRLTLSRSGPRSVCPAEPRCCCLADRASTISRRSKRPPGRSLTCWPSEACWNAKNGVHHDRPHHDDERERSGRCRRAA